MTLLGLATFGLSGFFLLVTLSTFLVCWLLDLRRQRHTVRARLQQLVLIEKVRR